LHEDDQGEEAVLVVLSERRGAAGSGGAMASTVVAEAWGFLFLWFHREKEKGRGVAARGWGRKGEP
jgi:hypothetical protein